MGKKLNVTIGGMDDSQNISDLARKYVKDNKRSIILHFADPGIYLPIEEPSAYFMAGSPGAGKTEFSKSFIEDLESKHPERKIVRIDADEIRELIPQYNGANSHLIQGAASLGVEKILDFVLSNNQDFLMDGTMSNYDVSCKNITRCINKNRKIAILYLYQDPLIAWDFTQKREVVEGRKIRKEDFIKTFFSAKESVNRLKKEFGDKIQVDLIVKNFEQGIEKTHFNVDNIDNYLKIEYNPQDLELKIIDIYDKN